MGYKLNGSPLAIGVAFTDSNGAQYPANWLRGSTAAERAAVPTGGITWEDDTPWYDEEFYWGPANPKDLTNLKRRWVNIQKDTAASLLASTDWMAIRQYEGGTAMPNATKTYRANVRTQCGLREATINACSDVDKLASTIRKTLAPTLAGTDSNGATEKKDESGNSYDPKQYNDIPNPDILEDWPTPPT